MNIYLSNPSLICCAGNCPSDFFYSITTKNQKGIKKTKCSLCNNSDISDNANKEFFVGKIDDDILKPTNDKFEMRILQILDYTLNQLEKTIQLAISKYGKSRIGVCLGSCDNGSELSLKAHKAFFTEGSFPSDYNIKAQSADYISTYVSKKYNLEGISLSFSTACSSSGSAIIKASELIKAGVCDAVIAGGVDIASDTVLLGFNSLEAISSKISNPFSKNRDGITLGEGASIFVLSKDDIDSTSIILAGCGESSDASHMTAPLADGSGAKQAMQNALNNSSLSINDIDYINLHGTGTHLNDSMESKAVYNIFGAVSVPVSTIKPITGHTLGAAASLELAACFLAIKNQKLPVQVWDKEFDNELPKLNFVDTPLPTKKIKCCMSNNFAFGGCNISLIIKEL